MDNVTDITVTHNNEHSDFVKPLRLLYKQNGEPKNWDMVKVHSSVVIVIYNVSRNVLVFVRQFRPAVYYNGIPAHDRPLPGDGRTVDTLKYPPKLGVTLELCAGIVDKDVSLQEVARIEVLEECGYDVPVQLFERIISYRSGVGLSGDLQTMFYVEVTDSMKVTSGGGNPDEGELIEVVEMSVAEVRAYISQPEILSPAGFLFGVNWFLAKKVSSLC